MKITLTRKRQRHGMTTSNECNQVYMPGRLSYLLMKDYMYNTGLHDDNQRGEEDELSNPLDGR